MREKKFNLIPLHQIRKLDSKENYRASVNFKHGYLNFSKEYVEHRNLIGKFLAVELDTTEKVIAWRVLDTVLMSDMKKYLKVRASKAGSGVVYTVYLGRRVRELNPKKDSYVGLKIQTYNEPGRLVGDKRNYIVCK